MTAAVDHTVATKTTDAVCEDGLVADEEELARESNVIAKDDVAVSWVQRAGRLATSVATAAFVFPISSGHLSVALEPGKNLFTARGDASNVSGETVNQTFWSQLVPYLFVLEAIGITLMLFPAHALSCVFSVVHRPLAVLQAMRANHAGSMQVLIVAGACGLFMAIGPALMLTNKHIMQEMDFSFPLSLGVIGLLSSAICSRLFVALGFVTVRADSLQVVSGRSWYQIALPIGVCKAITLASGNAVYLHLGLGFIQMLKAFTPVIVLFTMSAFKLAIPSWPAIGCVWTIVLGTLVEVRGELKATALGLLIMFTSEVAEAITLVITQKLLQNNKFTIFEGMYVLAPPGAACLLAAAAVIEWPRMIREGKHHVPLESPWWFLSAALLGLLVNFVGFLVVQVTSSLTMKILNTARCVGLVFISVIFYGETVMPLELVGYSVALAGFMGYNFLQLFPDRGEQLELGFRRCMKSLFQWTGRSPAEVVSR